MSTSQHLVLACAGLALLTFAVGLKMLQVRVAEMRARRISPQSVALSAQRAQQLEDSRSSDNYNHLFELPVLFYVLCLLSIATGHVPSWLSASAWAFVALRVVHTLIQCTYNRVMHRFLVFLVSFVLLLGMWARFLLSFLVQ